MRGRVLVAKNWLFEHYGAWSLHAFDCSPRKPMRRQFVSGFARALLSLSQEKTSGVEIGWCYGVSPCYFCSFFFHGQTAIYSASDRRNPSARHLYREGICLQTLLLLFKFANHRNKRPFVSIARGALVSLRSQTYFRFSGGLKRQPEIRLRAQARLWLAQSTISSLLWKWAHTKNSGEVDQGGPRP